MKKLSPTLFLLFLSLCIYGQSPEKMSYQAVIRDASNTLVTNQSIGMQISILQTTITGTTVYAETHTVTTNLNGLVSLEIGTGSTSDTFSTIDWSAGPYFIKTETDPTGGSSYTITGTSQLMSVPFAMYAKSSGNGITTGQSDAIAANTDKVGYTEALVSANTDVVANTAKTGITTDQSGAIVANTAKEGYTEALVSANTVVAANTLKVSYTQPIYSVNTFYAELGGYVIAVRDGGKNGLVVAMQDQGNSSWYEANDLLSDANNHDVNGAKFMDWRLPTKRELNLVYNQKSNIVGDFFGIYWSSTEYEFNYAWRQYFGDGTQYDGNKDDTVYVRAVRAF
ncbi:MAG: DUF1566 domain-containing protein [Flavobacteriaceae bacterium]|nr:DUF1566 domain-containing protein [Flavobacteriaceae bacterium]